MWSRRILLKAATLLPGRSCYCTTGKVWPERILSGIQPSGVLHLGNYIGAVQNWVNLQNSVGNVMCAVVDLHAITVPYDFQKLPEHILLMTACLIGCGIDPDKSVVFLQSEIPEHTQLGWVLGCFCTSPRLARLPQYREKSGTIKDIPLGLYVYPILQAADILLYQTTCVPVGIDQAQHLQLCSDLARKFNSIFGETFPVPRALMSDSTAKVKNLRDPTKKMSKSFPDSKSRIEMTDSSDVIREKIKKAVTDCTSKVSYDPKQRPGVSNLIGMHSAITGQTPEQICEEACNLNTGQYKLVVADILIERLKPIREEISRVYKDKSYIVSVLQKGASKARPIAADTWKLVREKTGITYNLRQ